MADIDPLTGANNKNAYIQWEKKINAAIEKGEQEPFAVAVFDINDLKKVNDLYGHKEGDACIRAACEKICAVFNRSPVFRVGGDEFIAILSGEDYRVRKELMNQINAIPSDRSKIRLGETCLPAWRNTTRINIPLFCKSPKRPTRLCMPGNNI